MSIVQDAVKKAQGASGYKINDDKKPGRNRGGNGYLLFFIIGGVLLVLLALVMMKSPKVPLEMSLKDMPAAEAIYKPISVAAAKPDNVKNTKSPPGLILSGIMQLVDGPRAIINDVMVGTGDIISGARVIKIDKDRVTLKDKDREMVLGME